jgi:probable F420-dependent oxidoreductase
MPANRLKLGFAAPVSGPWATPENQRAVARRAEELGYSSLWTFSRLLYPLGSSDDSWEEPFEASFREVAEPVVTLAYLAAHTDRIRLGTSVLILPFYSPAVLGRQLIQLDRISGGRLDIGVAAGWSPDEFRAAGVPMAHRTGRMLEYIEVLRCMWEHEEASFQGEFASLPRTLVRPRPVQESLPVLLGGGEKSWERAGRLANGWVGPAYATPDEVAVVAERVRAAAARAGKDPDDMRIVARGAVHLRSAGAADRIAFTGSLDEIADDIEQMARSGATELFLDLNFDDQFIAPTTSPDAAMDRAWQVLDAFAPAAGAPDRGRVAERTGEYR